MLLFRTIAFNIMLSFSSKFWIRCSLINLLFVAFLGVVMRYKIGFELPWIDQKHLQHAHSHFAFAGWISQMLMVLIVNFLSPKIQPRIANRFSVVLLLNLVCAYGMLIAFAMQGYGAVSIFFSTASIFVSFGFTWICFQTLNKPENEHPSNTWFRAALVFNVLSSLGTFALAYMMASKHIPQHAYLASVYWYLHFQYNGWFFFACAGLFIAYLITVFPDFVPPRHTFLLFAGSCIPAYGLSTLWLNLPTWIYLLIVIGAIAQALGWILFIRELIRIEFLKKAPLSLLGKCLFGVVAIALTIKLSLQLGSTLPAISKMAFGFRPIVIAYLHLVLLAFTSAFLLSYAYATRLLVANVWTTLGLIVFVGGIFLNELVLAMQGIASLSYHVVPFANETLFGIALLMFGGLLVLVYSQFRNQETI